MSAPTKVVYRIIDTMTRQVWSSAEARFIFQSQIQAIEAYNNSRHFRDPSYSAQTRYRVLPYEIGAVK